MTAIVRPAFRDGQQTVLGTALVTASDEDSARSAMGVHSAALIDSWFKTDDYNHCVHPEINAIEDGITTSVIGGGGIADVYPNLIGATQKPHGTSAPDPDNPYWTEDINRVIAAANVATICGGYDIINNQLAGFVGGGGHNWIKYNLNGHSVIVGGSFNLNCGARGFIGGGSVGFLGPDSLYSAIVVSRDSEVLSQHAFLGAGEECSISGHYSSIPAGRRCTVTHTRATMTGEDGLSNCDYSRTLSAPKLLSPGDVQAIETAKGLRTVDGSLGSINTIQTNGISGNITVHMGTVRLMGVRTSDGAVAAYSKDVICRIKDTNTASVIDLDSGVTTTSSGPIQELNELIDEIGIATPPHVRMTTGPAGQVIIRPTGLNATEILWVARFDVLNTRYVGS